MKLVIFTDGASFGNPGPMGLGAVIYRNRRKLRELSIFAGHGTNNIAEYLAVLESLNVAKKLGAGEITFKCDSQLVVRQLNGEYKVKNKRLGEIKEKIDVLCRDIKAEFVHIPRDKNKEADRLSKSAVVRHEAK